MTSIPTWKAMDPLVLLQDGDDEEQAWGETLNTEFGNEEAAISELLGGRTSFAHSAGQ
jgi:hypothetical protein